jgi:hypothetical protein
MCYRCGQADNFARDCPKTKGGAASLQTRNNHRPPTQARVYALIPSEAEMENEVVIGTLPLLTGKAVILFDSGAAHSFVSAKYARGFHINIELMEVGVVVSTLVGKLVLCRKIALGCPIHIEGRILSANLIVFDMEGFNIILEMDWLSNNHAIIDCHNKEIIFRILDDSGIQICGNQGGRYSTTNLSNTG